MNFRSLPYCHPPPGFSSGHRVAVSLFFSSASTASSIWMVKGRSSIGRPLCHRREAPAGVLMRGRVDIEVRGGDGTGILLRLARLVRFCVQSRDPNGNSVITEGVGVG